MSRTPPFAVAAGHRLTAETAAETLRAGGNAVDAAVAGALTACVAEPVLASLLGGGFLMARKPNGDARLLDFFVHPALFWTLGPKEAQRLADEPEKYFHWGDAGEYAAP